MPPIMAALAETPSVQLEIDAAEPGQRSSCVPGGAICFRVSSIVNLPITEKHDDIVALIEADKVTQSGKSCTPADWVKGSKEVTLLEMTVTKETNQGVASIVALEGRLPIPEAIGDPAAAKTNGGYRIVYIRREKGYLSTSYTVRGVSAKFSIGNGTVLTIKSATFLADRDGGVPYLGPAPPGFFSATKAGSIDWWFKDPETLFTVPFDQSEPGSYVFRLFVQLSGLTDAQMSAAMASEITPKLSIGFEAYTLGDRSSALVGIGSKYLQFNLTYPEGYAHCDETWNPKGHKSGRQTWIKAKPDQDMRNAGKGMITWTVYGELPRDLVASNTDAGPAAPPPPAGSAPNPATPPRKKEYFIEASVELDGSSAGGGAASSVATAGLLPSGAGGKTFFKSNNREHIYPMGCRDLACTHGIETDEAGVEVAVTGTDLTGMQVAATLAHKWVYGYSLPQPGASGVCKTPGPDAIEVNGFPLAVHGFQQQVKVGKITDPKDYSMQWGLVTCKATKTLYVVFRGTNPESLQDICLNTMAKPTTVGEEGGALAGAEFHTGFLGACTMHKQRVVDAIVRVCEGQSCEYNAAADCQRVVLTGHSLGGALASVMGLLLFGDERFPPEIKAKLHVLTFGQPLVMLDGAGPDAMDNLDRANAAALGGGRSAAAGSAGDASALGCVARRFQAVVNGMDIIPRLLGHRLNPSEAEVLRWIGGDVGSQYLQSYKDEIGWIINAVPRVHDYRPVGVYLYVRGKGFKHPLPLRAPAAGSGGDGLRPTEVVRIKPDWVMPFLRMHLGKDADPFKALGELNISVSGVYNRTGASPESIAKAQTTLRDSIGIADHTSYAERLLSAGDADAGRRWQPPGWNSIPFDAQVFP